MIIVIFCGGVGTRLWPLSTPEHPKQFINIVGDASQLRISYDRARQVTDEVYLLPETRLKESIAKQLPELSHDYIINEPARRGTANCLLAAPDALKRKGVGENEPIAFIHVDHFIRDSQGFVDTLRRAAEISTKHSSITLIGPEPTYPATIFGYIHKNKLIDDDTIAYTVSEFKEKPDAETAKRFMASGEFRWNCGYFVASINTFLQTMQQDAPEMYQNY